MRIPIFSKGPWLSAAVTIAVAAALLFAHQGAANAGIGPPGAPANPLAHLIVPEGGDPRIRVSWDAPGAPVSGYTVARADGTSFQAAGTVTTYSDHAVEPGTSYTYTVTAQNEQGSSPASETASAGVPPAPSMPSGLSASLEDPSPSDQTATVNLSWTPATVPEAAACKTAYPVDGYTLHRHDGAVEEELAELDADATSFTDAGAAFGTSYTYRVSAQSAVGPGETAEINAKTPPRPVGVPKELTVNTSNLDAFDDSITLEWQPPGEGPEVTGYRITRRAGGEGPAVLAERHERTSYVDDSVSAAVPYSYTVAARSADNVSADTPAVSLEVPAAVTDLTAAVVNGQVQLAWNPDQTGREVIYRVQRRKGDEEWRDLEGTSGLVLAASHTDTAAEPDTVHTYRVQTRTAGIGGSAWTESGPVTIVSLPGAPGSVTAQADGNDNVITWDAPESAFIDGYRVRHRTGEAEWRVLAESITGASHRHTGTQADVTHHYGVQAYNAAGDGPWSKNASAGRVTPPLAPGALSAAVDGNDILLTWERPPTVHVDSYTVRHEAGGESTLTTLPGSATSHRLADAPGNTLHRFTVRAENSGGQSPWSEPAEITRALAPPTPADVTAEAGDLNIVVSWTAVAGPLDGYQLRYRSADQEEWSAAETGAGLSSFTHEGSREGVTYEYQVRAHNQAGPGPWSEPAQAVRLLAPGAPTGLTATVSGSSITLSWTAPAPGIVDSYDVEYGPDGSEETRTASIEAPAATFEHLGAPGDTTHRYRVRSRNQAGPGPWTGYVRAMRVIPPKPPAGVGAVISNEDILVSWTRPSGGIIDRYQVERRQLERQDWVRAEVDAGTTSYTHVGPTPGVTHEYRVRSVNAGGVSDWTDPVTGTWHRGAAPPSRIFATGLGNQVLLQWLPSVTEGVTGYDLRYRIDGGAWTPGPEETNRRVHLAGWSEDEAYHEYAVRAVIGGEKGDWSAVQRVVIERPGPAPELRANREGAAGVRLHWDMPGSGPPALFIIEGRTGNRDYRRIASVNGYATTYRVHRQLPGTTYDYRVLAQNHVRIKGPHDEDNVRPVTIPEEPQQFSRVPGRLELEMVDPGTVRLSWKAPEQGAGQVTSYRVYRREAAESGRIGDSFSHVLVRQTGNTDTRRTDAAVEPGVAYEYAVAAYREGYPHPLSDISQPVYATPW